jgi:hypothetical protein
VIIKKEEEEEDFNKVEKSEHKKVTLKKLFHQSSR